MKNRLATLVGALALSAAASAQTWIWYPGDYEIWPVSYTHLTLPTIYSV